MDVKTWVRWDGKTEDDGKDAVFVPDAYELLSCGSKREGDENTWMGMESLKMAELYLKEATVDHWECRLRTRKQPMLGFQVPRFDPMYGPTETGRVLSKQVTILKADAEAETGIKMYGTWSVKQCIIVREYRMTDPDIGDYTIPVLKIRTWISKVSLGRGTRIYIPMEPDQCEINAFWMDVYQFVVQHVTERQWLYDEPWKTMVWGSGEKKELLSEQHLKSPAWRLAFHAGTNGMTPEDRKMTAELRYARILYTPREGVEGIQDGKPVALMMVLEHFEQQKRLLPVREAEMSEEEDSKPAAKRNNEHLPEEEQGRSRKKRRSGHENLLEEGSVAEAKGFASGPSGGESNA
jgi:hypothetical protein